MNQEGSQGKWGRTVAHRVPDILSGDTYRELPLYMLIAWWVHLQDSPVSVRDVSVAFHISARRASDVLLYLLKSVSHVQCTRDWLSLSGGGRQRGGSVQRLGDLQPRTSTVEGSFPRPGTPVMKAPASRIPHPASRIPHPGVRGEQQIFVSCEPGWSLVARERRFRRIWGKCNAYFYLYPKQVANAGPPGGFSGGCAGTQRGISRRPAVLYDGRLVAREQYIVTGVSG